MLLCLNRSSVLFVDYVFQQRIKVDDIIGLRRVPQHDHHQLLRWEDKDILTVVAVAIVHILRYIRELPVSV